MRIVSGDMIVVRFLNGSHWDFLPHAYLAGFISASKVQYEEVLGNVVLFLTITATGVNKIEKVVEDYEGTIVYPFA